MEPYGKWQVKPGERYFPPIGVRDAKRPPPPPLATRRKPVAKAGFLLCLFFAVVQLFSYSSSKLPGGTLSRYSNSALPMVKVAEPLSEAGTTRSSATLPKRFSAAVASR
jgi:hypothetical protein